MRVRLPLYLRRLSALSLLAFGLGVSPCLLAQDAPKGVSIDANGVVRDISFFYQNRGRFDSPQPIELQFTVLYYDPGWRVMWVRSDTSSHFIRVAEKPMPLEPGSRYRVRGTISNADGFSANPEDIVLVDTPGLPAPISASDRLHEWSALGAQWVRLEAYVDRQNLLEGGRLHLSALVRGRRVALRLRTQGEPVPRFEGTFVEVSGVYAYTAPVLSAPATVEIWSPSLSCIQIKNTAANDPRFEIAASPIESIRQAQGVPLIRIVGALHRQDRGRSLTLRDATGQVTVVSDQDLVVPIGTLVEAVGKPATDGPQLRLIEAQYRMLPAESVPQFSDATAESLQLRFNEQVSSLSPEELKGRPLVALTGMVTWSHPDTRYFYFQDATGGIKVHMPPNEAMPVNFSGVVRIRGRATAGVWLPEVEATEIARGADGILGQPRALTLDQAVAGVAEGQWIELVGFVRAVQTKLPWTHLLLTTPSGEFTARMPEFPDAKLWVNSVVHVRGVGTSVLNARGEPAGIELLMQSAEHLSVEAALPSDLSSLPMQSIERLHARGTRVELNRWVRTRGIVTYVEPGNALYLQEGSKSIRVLSRDPSLVRLGEHIDLVGLLGRESGKQVLREARVTERLATPGDNIVPVAASDSPDRSLDGLVATLSGVLVNVVDRGDQRRLVLETNQRLIECVLVQSTPTPLPRGCEPGARIEATGIYHVELNDYREPRNFNILLREGRDIHVKTPAPWWNLSRALGVAAGLSLISLGVIAWVALLRRTVRKQTQQLLEQKDKEAKLEAELERSARLESLGVLAGGIAHDFNNMLTVVVGNITLSVLETPSDSKAAEFLTEAEKAALRARSLTQQLLTFARGGDPVRSSHRLAPIVEESALFALRGSPVRGEFDLAEGLPPALVDKSQFSQAINNLVLHASRSMPKGGKIHFTLRETPVFENEIPNLAAGTYLKLAIEDNGPGIPAEHIGKVWDPYFVVGDTNNGLGLATVRSIIRRHLGHAEVTSKPGQGTTYTLWIPTTPDIPASETTPPEGFKANRRLRVLFMDDDESIRKFAQTVLARLGHEPVVVPDGTAAVHAYAAAWETNTPFDVVILDLTVVGGMGGKEALEHLQNIDPQVRAIVSSGYSSDPVMSDYRAFGFAGIVSKPYKISDLERNLLEVMEQAPPGQGRG